ncbi:MFS transporter [Pseudonocardia sp. KRD291]|uniref:MFS transporter n=1 Tax=Pseudonocardia sp. KRD291 TaxID=2792007 RepID=UPI001C4A6372|nr:MFS transporter [Pseudonocardia sp. KRD291]MBW0101264.1 MFS transporter [Pseudonocardia sp. KRD291]
MPSSVRRWWILAVIGIAQLMVILDNTIVNIALPSAQLDLGFTDPQRQWIVTAYALSFGSLLLLGGRLSDVFGRRGAFVVGLVGFAVASILGGLSPSFEVLVAARVLQGVFGALLAPAALSLLTTTFPSGKDRATAFGVFSAVAGSGAALGLLLGGALTQFVDWRWCLYVNAVFAVAAIIGALLFMPAVPAPENRPRLDVVGTVLASAGLFCLVYGLGSAESDGWSSPSVYVFLAAGLVLLVAFVIVQRRVASPLLPLRVLLDRYRGGSFLTILTLTLGMFSVSLFLTFVLQQNLGFSPLLSGLAFLPMVASIVTTSTTIPSTVLPRIGPKPLIFTGLLLGSGAMFWLSFLDSGSSYAGSIVGPMILMGLGMGTAMSTSINTATLGVQPRDAGVASATVNTMQQVGGSVGTALLSSVAGTAGAAFVVSTGSSPLDGTLHGYAVAFLVASAVFLVAAVVCGAIVPFGRPHRIRSDAEEAAAVTTPAGGDDFSQAPGGDPEHEPALPGHGGRVPGPGPALVGQVHGVDDAAPGTVLTLIDATNGRQVARAVTDAHGRYRLDAPRPGSYTVVANAPGHRPVAERHSLTAEAREAAVHLQPLATLPA